MVIFFRRLFCCVGRAQHAIICSRVHCKAASLLLCLVYWAHLMQLSWICWSTWCMMETSDEYLFVQSHVETRLYIYILSSPFSASPKTQTIEDQWMLFVFPGRQHSWEKIRICLLHFTDNSYIEQGPEWGWQWLGLCRETEAESRSCSKTKKGTSMNGQGNCFKSLCCIFFKTSWLHWIKMQLRRLTVLCVYNFKQKTIECIHLLLLEPTGNRVCLRSNCTVAGTEHICQTEMFCYNLGCDNSSFCSL